MARSVKLLGLDCGSTTTSLIVAQAKVAAGALGRMEITQVEPVFSSPIVFTPFAEDRIDVAMLARYLEGWLATAGIAEGEIFGGGALVTGLAAERLNAAAVTQWLETRLADSVVATADDPCLESWLAFMGNCHALSRAHPILPILNLDIGGGTTNLALGVNGQVVATGCLMIGARHFQFTAGAYELTRLSAHAAALLEHLRIDCRVGDVLEAAEVEAIVDWYVRLVEDIVAGRFERLDSAVAKSHLRIAPRWPAGVQPPFAITLSGGVGQLAYHHRNRAEHDDIARFGDLGDELARRILKSSPLSESMGTLLPEGLGRATVYGLLRHATAPSGATIYLPCPERLPLRNVPIVGTISLETTDDKMNHAIGLAARSAVAACLRIDLLDTDPAAVRDLGGRLGKAIASGPFPRDRTLVMLVPANAGKALGNYVTRWGTLEVNLIVVDELILRDAQFVRLGQVRDGIVPVSLYAMR